MFQPAIQSSLMVFLAIIFVAGASADADIVAHWSGDGNAFDSVAGRNGTLENGASYGSGRHGQAFRLDGFNDYVSVPDDDVWTFGSDPFTIALWVNFDVINAATFDQLPNVFLGHDDGAGATNKWVYYFDDEGYPIFLNGPGGVDGVNFVRPAGKFLPTVGQWHHFAVTRSGDTYTFYADGNSLGTADASVITPNSAASLTIGQAEGLGFLEGRLDEIRIYNEALTQSQVQQLAGIPEPATFAFLVFGLMILASGYDYLARASRRQTQNHRS